MNLLEIPLTKEEESLKNRIFNLHHFDGCELEKDTMEMAIRCVKTYGLDLDNIPDFSLKVLTALFDINDSRQIEHLYIGLGNKRSVTNAANYLVRNDYCYWDEPDCSNIEYGHSLTLNKNKYLTEDFIR